MSLPGLIEKLVLVSHSPQRVELLRQAGYRFDVVTPAFEEPRHKPPHLTPAQHVQAMAFFKAASVAEHYPDQLLLGADTVVSVGADLFGKPVDRADARRILSILTRRPHQVITGIALLAPALDRRVIADDVTTVTLKPMSDAALEAYLDTNAWQGKAGAYGLQAGADAFVERIEGSYSNVIGLPMELLGRMLKQF
jgi:septum formation protein